MPAMTTPAPRQLQKMLLLDEVADLLQVDERTVRRYCSMGDLEFVKLGHGTLRFKPEWVDDFIARKQGRG